MSPFPLFCVSLFLMHCGSWILIDRVPNIRPQILHCIEGGPDGVEGADEGEGVVTEASVFTGDLGCNKN